MAFVDRLKGRASRDTTKQPPSFTPSAPPPRLPTRPPATARDQGREAPRENVSIASAPILSQPNVLRDVFTPTRPQRSLRRTAGRQKELLRIFRAIAVDRAHVVVYGERGRGKTSLVNLVAAAARSAGYMVGRYACAFDSTYDDIIRGLARDLPASLLAVPAVQDDTLEGCEAALPRGRIQPRDVAALAGRLAGRRLLMIADEFDRVEDADTRTRFADTIKQVSDRGVTLSFIIVGVSDSLEELLGRHPSIQRNVLGLPLPLLSDDEIGEILETGGREAGIEFPRDVRAAIAAFARGVPYIAQLLGLHACNAALERGARMVGASDLKLAVRQAVDEADPLVVTTYEHLVGGGRDAAMRNALVAIANGQQDRLGRFSAEGVEGAMLVAGKRVEPGLWTRLLEARAIRPTPSAGPSMFAFADAMLPHYIGLRNALERHAAFTEV